MSTLFVVGTPIGNLEDITLRAMRILREVGLIAAEDTRHTRHLLSHFEITTPLTSYHEHNKDKKLSVLLEALRENDVALVSDAGMPGISDPGYELVRAAREAGHMVRAVPGPSAVTTALAISGLPVDQFVYVGFLPRKKGERAAVLSELARETRTIVAFETPHRLLAALEDIAQHLGERPLAVARALTKVHEEVVRGTAQDLLAHFAAGPIKGEFTLVIGPGQVDKKTEPGRVRGRLSELRREGLSARDAVAQVAAETGESRRSVYQTLLEMETPGW